ncbi:MAG: hypothetical protein LUG91_06060 [Ruminococcus sp.]|nr:hypothetical protein [Ruminococcus sp.]
MPVVKSYTCQSCGASIDNLNKPTGKCEYCGTSYVIESLKECQELAKTENVISGVPFKASSKRLHEVVVKYLTSNEAAPLDVLSASEITSAEYLFVPAYYYHANGTSDYLCDIGNDNTRTYKDSNGSKNQVVETNWSTVSGNVRGEFERIVSGYRDYDFVIDKMYSPYKNGVLVDVESLEIPLSATTLKFTRPDSELMDKYVRPDMEEALKNSAIKQIGNRKYRNLNISGNCNMEVDKSTKVLAAMHKIKVTYGSGVNTLYISGDGEKLFYDKDSPVDPQRAQVYKDLVAEKKSVQGKMSFFKALMVIGIILALGFFLFGDGGSSIVWGIIFAAAAVLGFVQNRALRVKRDELQQQIDFFTQQIKNIRTAFLNENQKLRGAEHLGTDD